MSSIEITDLAQEESSQDMSGVSGAGFGSSTLGTRSDSLVETGTTYSLKSGLIETGTTYVRSNLIETGTTY